MRWTSTGSLSAQPLASTSGTKLKEFGPNLTKKVPHKNCWGQIPKSCITNSSSLTPLPTMMTLPQLWQISTQPKRI